MKRLLDLSDHLLLTQDVTSNSLLDKPSGLQVEMTTGATIHTTQGLKMTVTRRTRPPIVPTLEMPTVRSDSTLNISEMNTVPDEKSEVSPSRS